jgi:hypothetical protein
MNKKAISPITVFIYAGVFIVFWIFLIAPLLNFSGQSAISSGNLTGIDALLWSNLNLIAITIPFVIWIIAGVFSR